MHLWYSTTHLVSVTNLKSRQSGCITPGCDWTREKDAKIINQHWGYVHVRASSMEINVNILIIMQGFIADKHGHNSQICVCIYLINFYFLLKHFIEKKNTRITRAYFCIYLHAFFHSFFNRSNYFHLSIHMGITRF